MKYEVRFEVTGAVTVYVEADSKEKAKAKAKEMVKEDLANVNVDVYKTDIDVWEDE